MTTYNTIEIPLNKGYTEIRLGSGRGLSCYRDHETGALAVECIDSAPDDEDYDISDGEPQAAIVLEYRLPRPRKVRMEYTLRGSSVLPFPEDAPSVEEFVNRTLAQDHALLVLDLVRAGELTATAELVEPEGGGGSFLVDIPAHRVLPEDEYEVQTLDYPIEKAAAFRLGGHTILVEPESNGKLSVAWLGSDGTVNHVCELAPTKQVYEVEFVVRATVTANVKASSREAAEQVLRDKECGYELSTYLSGLEPGDVEWGSSVNVLGVTVACTSDDEVHFEED